MDGNGETWAAGGLDRAEVMEQSRGHWNHQWFIGNLDHTPCTARFRSFGHVWSQVGVVTTREAFCQHCQIPGFDIQYMEDVHCLEVRPLVKAFGDSAA